MISPPKKDSRRKNSILMWPGQPTGSDHLTHFWAAIADALHRLCDGASWPEGRSNATVYDAGFSIPCRACKEIYLQDLLSGRRVLEFSPDPLPLTNGASTPKIGAGTPNIGVPHSDRVSAMPRVPMSTFARFYAARGAGQLAVVERARLQLKSPDVTGGGFYSPLRQFLSATHWNTGSIESLEDVRGRFLVGQRANKVPHFTNIIINYLELWKRRGAEFFVVDRYDYDFDGLTIRVNPEVGMRNDEGERVLKLWFDAPRLPRQIRQISEYLMAQAQLVSPDWDSGWQCGMWDIRRKNTPIPLPVPQSMDAIVGAQVAAFLGIWNHLEQQES